jgi:hypothetical protein
LIKNGKGRLWLAAEAYGSAPTAIPCNTGLMSIPPKLAIARALLDDYLGM